MEGQSDFEKHSKLMSLAFGRNANVTPYVLQDDPNQHYQDDPNQHYLVAAGRNESHYNALNLPHWAYEQQTSHNYVKYLAENSTYEDHNGSLPVCSMHPPNGVSEVQSEVLSNDSRKARDFEPAVSNLDMVSLKVMPSLHIPNSNYHEGSSSGAGFMHSGQNEMVDGVRYLKPHNEGNPFNAYTNPQIVAQINSTWREQGNGDTYHVYEPHSGVKIAEPGIPSKRHYTKRSREKSAETDRLRRLKIAERHRALQDLLPQYKEEGSQAPVTDDIVEYIKNLQLQMKELTQSRLGGEFASDPFVSLEGSSRLLSHEQAPNKPLEEMIGDILNENPAAATQFLESRGLILMPTALAEDLL